MTVVINESTVIMKESYAGKVAELAISGTLRASDYEIMVPELERLIERHGRIRLLILLVDFDGWTASALWEDLTFDARHIDDFERIAVVGEERWQKGLTDFARPFTTASMRFFASRFAAEEWITDGLTGQST